jgi:HNH endonuclease
MGRIAPRAIRRAVLARDNETCQYCGFPGDQVDHIIPWAWTRVGAHAPSNLVCCCRRCNGLLGGQVFEDFEAKKRFIRDTLWPVKGLPPDIEEVRRRAMAPKALPVPSKPLTGLSGNPDPLGVWPGSQGHVWATQLTLKPLKRYTKGRWERRGRSSRPKPNGSNPLPDTI